jgi:uncharacterized protein
MLMVKDHIGYEALADSAMRSVVKEALRRAEKQGLIGHHHFYIAFKTHDPSVDIPEFLKERFPDEMTIVLQNQFWGLKVGEDSFEVGLTFQKMPATLVIPYAALTSFVDPGVQFGLQFRNSSAALSGPVPAPPPEKPEPETEGKTRAPEQPPPPSDPQIVSLDKFRKK